ncbi:glycosyltransferase family 4 protein [bacterium]|nr:glycosyltransferase family 4 protein [bacterium]
MKILVWADSPTVTTGFGIVAKNIITGIKDKLKLDITWLGINYEGEPHDFNFPIYPPFRFIGGEPDVYGRKRLLELLVENQFDLLFILNDPWIVASIWKQIEEIRKQQRKTIRKTFKIIFYCPVDGPLDDFSLIPLKEANQTVVATNWAKDILSKHGIDCQVIYHGAEVDEFYPTDVSDFKKDNFGDSYLISNIGRNVYRKNLELSLLVLKELKEKIPVKLYLHCNKYGDINLPKVASYLGLKENQDYYTLPPEFAEHRGLPKEYLNTIYNISDVVFSTTSAEGWGLPVVSEAPLTMTPVIVPDINPFRETLKDRAIFYRTSGLRLSPDSNRFRPYPDYKDLSQKILEVLKAKEKPDCVQRAYDFAQSCAWSKINEKWVELLQKM